MWDFCPQYRPFTQPSLQNQSPQQRYSPIELKLWRPSKWLSVNYASLSLPGVYPEIPSSIRHSLHV